ncbi:MAG: hypothetical protein GJV46_10075 [Geobacter sp.]|nr:hypothetical protein [Geobacter sp.]
MELKQQITNLLATDPMTSATINQIKALLADPQPTKAKQLSQDQREIANLKKTIKALKELVEPASTTKDSDQLLDDMYQLKQNRTLEIETKGEPVTLGTSDRIYKALQVSDNTFHFAPGTPVAVGTKVTSKGSLCVITEFKHVAGRITAKTWTPSSAFTVYSKTDTKTGGVNLKLAGSETPCTFTDNILTTFNIKQTAGTIVKVSNSFYEVTGTYTDGLLVKHQLAPFESLSVPAPQAEVRGHYSKVLN